MARYRGTLQGCRGEASRLGHSSSGLTTVAASWQGAVRVELYACGDFTMAGGKNSSYAARAYLELPTLSIHPSGSAATVSWPASYGRFILQQTPDLTKSSNWSNASYPITTNSTTKSATVPLTPTKQFFRLIE